MTGKSGCSLHWGGLDKAMLKAGHHLANTEALMESIGEALVSGTIKRFAAGKSPDGKDWQPSGRALAEGGQTLVDTGALRNSIDYATSPGKVVVGTNKEYARIHQFGGTIKPKKGKFLKFKGQNGKDVFVEEVTLPPRPFIGVSREDLEEVKGTISDFIAGAFGVGGSSGRGGK